MSDAPERDHAPDGGALPEALRARLDEEAPADRAALGAVWHLLGEPGHADAPVPDVDRAWAAVEARLARPPAQPSRRPRSSRGAARPARRLGRWTAAAAAALVVGFVVWWSRPVDLRVAPGARLATTLPDGSAVTLVGGSELRYRRGFSLLPGVLGRDRHVALRGEAFFEVVPGARPFVVETFDAYVEVLGTRFEVQAWDEPSLHATQVVLASGAVRLSAKAEGGAPVVLREGGHRAQTVRGQAAAMPEAAPFDVARAWQSAGFYAANQPLEAILLRLEQRYGERLVLSTGAAAGAALTLYYPEAVPLETILEDICTARGLGYRPVRGGYEIVDRQPD